MSIISFSGIDGSGKTTQIELVEQFLNQSKIKYMRVWARGSWTPGIELVKKIVRKDKRFSEREKELYRNEARSNPRTAKRILVLSILDMIWYFGIWYRILNLSTKVLICDRYIWDTLVDFRVAFSRFNFEEWYIWRFLIWFIPKPNKSILLYITSEMSIERGLKKNEEFMESFEIKRKKVDEYRSLITLNKWTGVINADDTVENIFEIIRRELAK
jgi:thymidylate kinase